MFKAQNASPREEMAKTVKIALQLGAVHGKLAVCGSGRSVAWLARVVRVHEVVSSNLTAPTIFFRVLFWAGPSRVASCRGPAYFLDMQQHDLQPASAASPAAGSLICRLLSIVDRLEVGETFPTAQPLEVELGSGDGSFLVNYAKLHAEKNFVGVERLLGRLRKLDRKGLRAGLTNLRCLRIESAYFLEYLLAPHSASAIHVYFPDPWPKRKHRKNRLVNSRFTEIAHQALTPGGVVYLRTDDEDYFTQMATVFAANSAFQLMETPAELTSVVTDFERNFHARGVATLRAAYLKVA